MRILLSAYACEPNRGSEPGNGWNWAFHLAESGHQVHLLTRLHGRKAIDDALRERPMSNLQVHYVDVPKWSKRLLHGQGGVYAHYLLWQRAAFNVGRLLAPEIDLIHHVTWGSLKGGSKLWKLDLPFILGPIGGGQLAPSSFKQYWGDEWHSEAIRSFVTEHGLKWHWAARRLLGNADLVLVTNQETQALCARLGGKRIEPFFDAGLGPTHFPDHMPIRALNDRLRILWVGRIYPYKGLQLALEALAEARIPFEFTIAGDGPWGKRVPQWIEELGLAGRVALLGQIRWDQVLDLYAQHDVFFFPTLRDSCPAQLLEAMAFGLPIVTLNHHGARSLVPDSAGIKVNVSTPDETRTGLAHALERLWKNPEERNEMGERGHAFALAEVWPKKVLKMTRHYEEVGSK